MKTFFLVSLLVSASTLAGCASNPFSSAPEVDQKKFETLYRTAKQLELLGESSPEYGKLQEALFAELSLARGRATTAAERRIIALYDDAWNAVLDTDLAYREKVQRGVKKETKEDPRQSDLWLRSWQLLGAANRCYLSSGKDCAEPQGSSKSAPTK